MISDSPVSKIKDRLDIVDVIGGYMKIQKAGINYKGRCPFHNEKTPSFFVSPDRQIWHCFGCAKGGDIFEFVKEIEGVEFPEALRILANKAGIQLENRRAFVPEGAADAKTKLYEISELATKFFQKQFQSTAGKKALAYLHDRGLTDETIAEFRLGFAPQDWEAISKYIVSCGYTEQEVVDAGLAIRRDESKGRGRGIYDRFRSRIMFPIFDISGQTVGFTGRIFESSPSGQEGAGDKPLDQDGPVMAKYVNTPGTLIYDKSRVLYGLSKAKLDIRKADACILVEGNMDALMSYQAGARNVVASSGTALTPHHLRLLQRYTKHLGFCFDTDQAGAMATRRGIGLALAQQFNISVIELRDPECKDPADFVKKYGSVWTDVVGAAKPVIDYYFDLARASYNPASAESKKQVLAAVAPFVKRLPSSVERAHWISQLAMLLQAPAPAITADVLAFKDDLDAYASAADAPSPVSAVSAVAPAPKVAPPDLANEALLSVAITRPSVFRAELAELPYEILNVRTADILRRLAQAPEPFSFKDFVAQFEEEDALHLEFAYLRSQELWHDFRDQDLYAEFHTLLNVLRRRAINARLTTLQFDIRQAEQSADSARIRELAQEFNSLAHQLTLTHINFTSHGNQKESFQKIGQETSSSGQTQAAAQEAGQESASQETPGDSPAE
ncbi:MAG TPA: DNA primase [Candidatus Paceibacterota bacterium]|nr:DNA primase [Candidatus Paceibacterota bacterium]